MKKCPKCKIRMEYLYTKKIKPEIPNLKRYNSFWKCIYCSLIKTKYAEISIKTRQNPNE